MKAKNITGIHNVNIKYNNYKQTIPNPSGLYVFPGKSDPILNKLQVWTASSPKAQPANPPNLNVKIFKKYAVIVTIKAVIDIKGIKIF